MSLESNITAFKEKYAPLVETAKIGLAEAHIQERLGFTNQYLSQSRVLENLFNAIDIDATSFYTEEYDDTDDGQRYTNIFNQKALGDMLKDSALPNIERRARQILENKNTDDLLTESDQKILNGAGALQKIVAGWKMDYGPLADQLAPLIQSRIDARNVAEAQEAADTVLRSQDRFARLTGMA